MTARVSTFLQQAKSWSVVERNTLLAELCKELCLSSKSSPVPVEDENNTVVAYVYAPGYRIAAHEWNESQEWLDELKRRAKSASPTVEGDAVMIRLRDRHGVGK